MYGSGNVTPAAGLTAFSRIAESAASQLRKSNNQLFEGCTQSPLSPAQAPGLSPGSVQTSSATLSHTSPGGTPSALAAAGSSRLHADAQHEDRGPLPLPPPGSAAAKGSDLLTQGLGKGKAAGEQQQGAGEPSQSQNQAMAAAGQPAAAGKALPLEQADGGRREVGVDSLGVLEVPRLELFTRPQALPTTLKMRTTTGTGPGPGTVLQATGEQASTGTGAEGRVQVLDSSTSNNILIKFRDTTPEALGAALEDLEPRAFTSALVLQCTGLLANTKVVGQVTAWLEQPGNSMDQLGPAEMFVHVLVSSPDVRQRLELLRLHHYFAEDLPRKLADVQRVEQVCQQLHSSKAWRRLLHQLLAAGNVINQHRAPGRPAQAFKLTSLPKFADMRSAGTSSTTTITTTTSSGRTSSSTSSSSSGSSGSSGSNGSGSSSHQGGSSTSTSGTSGTCSTSTSSSTSSSSSRTTSASASSGSGSSRTTSSSGSANSLGKQRGSWMQWQQAVVQGEQGRRAAGKVQVLALEAALGVVKETDLKQLGSEVAELEGKERVQELKDASSSACRAVRELAAWHLEAAGPGWELQNSKPWFENLWRFVRQVKESAVKIRSLLERWEKVQAQQAQALTPSHWLCRQQQQQGGAHPPPSQPTHAVLQLSRHSSSSSIMQLGLQQQGLGGGPQGEDEAESKQQGGREGSAATPHHQPHQLQASCRRHTSPHPRPSREGLVTEQLQRPGPPAAPDACQPPAQPLPLPLGKEPQAQDASGCTAAAAPEVVLDVRGLEVAPGMLAVSWQELAALPPPAYWALAAAARQPGTRLVVSSPLGHTRLLRQLSHLAATHAATAPPLAHPPLTLRPHVLVTSAGTKVLLSCSLRSPEFNDAIQSALLAAAAHLPPCALPPLGPRQALLRGAQTESGFQVAMRVHGTSHMHALVSHLQQHLAASQPGDLLHGVKEQQQQQQEQQQQEQQQQQQQVDCPLQALGEEGEESVGAGSEAQALLFVRQTLLGLPP
ncbi:hypothetical protein QJQ45_024371 [Haematococcus lacustris]|nr:hypothetical protein QJQ45_024371 [Haematococcus lacustris]